MDKPKRKKKMRVIHAGIAEQLVKAIARSGKSHYAIGKESGVSPAVIDRFVTGHRDVRMSTASRIADALGLKLMEKK